jgi:hypothetical protein
MGSLQRPRLFGAQELEIFDRVHATCWEWYDLREPVRDKARDDERQEKLRRLVLAFGRRNLVDYDLLYEVVLENLSVMSLPLERALSSAEPKKRARRIKVLTRPHQRIVRRRRNRRSA